MSISTTLLGETWSISTSPMLIVLGNPKKKEEYIGLVETKGALEDEMQEYKPKCMIYINGL